MKIYVRASKKTRVTANKNYSVDKNNMMMDFLNEVRILVSRKCNNSYWRFKVDGVPYFENGYIDLDISFYGLGGYRDGGRKEMSDMIGDVFVTYLDDIALDDPNELRCAVSENADGSRPFATGRTLDDLIKPTADYIISVINDSQYN